MINPEKLTHLSPGQRLRFALAAEAPLQIVGVINAYCALLAKQAGFKAMYLSGAGVANAAFGLPDLGLTSLTEVTQEVQKLTACCALPLIVDVDTGWGSPLNVYHSFFQISRAGAAGAHIEDQVFAKRCGHRDNKQLVSANEMVARIQAAIDGRIDSDFMVIARTDALAVEGVAKTLERAILYEKAGADMLFLEAVTDLAIYQQFASQLNIPILANITEFGKTPLWTVSTLKKAGVQAVLYPLSAFRAMSLAAQKTYEAIRHHGTQESILSTMQTREDLYRVLDYQKLEQKMDDYLCNIREEEK